jgi:2-polyprenyl-6-methoxyphenol hydroxylase-like FAD-dependent oxidoreductase
MKIDVIGAGPGGLYFALLAKKRNPQFQIRVYERNPLDATYGFGIALQHSSWEFLAADDKACLKDIIAASTPIHGQQITHQGQSIEFRSPLPNAGIERMALLQVLRRHASEAGVEVFHNYDVSDLVRHSDADIVVGADGVHSVVRTAQEAAFGTSTRTLTSRLAWYGTSKPVGSSRRTFGKTPYGYFWSVGYAHSTQGSTFVAECEEKAWHACGLAEMDAQEQVRFSESIFAAELQGARILSNHSAWKPLPVIRVQHWNVGRHVLLGDALHSPHPSIGSGTRLSMGDASALAQSQCDFPTDPDTALAQYRIRRESSKMKLVVAMEKSLDWYERIGARLDDLSPVELVYDYMSRTGRMSLERIKMFAPDFYSAYGAQFEAIEAARTPA